MRINLGAAFSELFKGEEGGINVVFKLYDEVGKICGCMAFLHRLPRM